MHKQRLNRLAEHLRTLDEDLYMYTWFSDCGTAACAIGHATLIPEFQEEGFQRFWSGVKYKGAVSWDAVEAFFEISSSEAHWLFGGDQYKSLSEEHLLKPSRVAERIQSLMENASA